MKPSPADTHVVIAGAGIAGLAAAMILAEAGVRVTLCEAASEAGGKAKSLRLADGHPTEHSLRVYTDTYQTLLTLFSRIPTEHDRTVLDNLVGVSMVSATAQGVIGRIAAPVALQRRRPTFARIIGKVVEPPRQLVRILLRGPMVIVGLAQRGVPATDVLHYSTPIYGCCGCAESDSWRSWAISRMRIICSSAASLPRRRNSFLLCRAFTSRRAPVPKRRPLRPSFSRGCFA